MKKSVVIVFFLLTGICISLKAQNRISVNAYGGYVFQNRIELQQYYGYILAAGQYCGSFEFELKPNESIELKHLRQDKRAPLYYYSGGTQANKGDDNISLNYMFLEGNRYFPIHSSVKPYAGLGIGLGIADSKDGDGSLTKFEWECKLGIKLKPPNQYLSNCSHNFKAWPRV